MRDTIESLRRDVEAVQDQVPLRKGGTRKKVIYPDEIRARAAALWRQTGESSEVFAERLGVSPSVVRRWHRDCKAVGFIPVAVRATTEVPPVAQMPAAPMPERASAKGGGLAVTFREVRLDLPRDVDARQLAELVAQLKGGASC